MDLATLIGVCNNAITVGSKAVNMLRKTRLTKEEKELLVAADSRKGHFHFFSLDAIPGGWINAGGNDFFDKKDFAYNAKYVEAFRRLCERGYVEHRSSTLFVLTASGFEKAEKSKRRGS